MKTIASTIRETLRWNTIVSMLLVVAAVFFAFLGGVPGQKVPSSESSVPGEPTATLGGK